MTNHEGRILAGSTEDGLPSVDGDATTEEQLYLAWAPGLRRYFASHGVSDREDLTHDVLLAVVDAMRRRTLRNDAALPGFVWIIAKRRLWRENARRASLTSIDTVPEPEGPSFDGEAVVEEREYREIAKRVLLSMPGKSREVLVRFYVHCEPPEAIRAQMGLTETQFRLLKSRAKAAFQAQVRRKERRPLSTLEGTRGASLSGQHRGY